jgi:hypothetical protein
MSKRDNKRFNDKERKGAPKRGGKNRRDYGDEYSYEPKKKSASSGTRRQGRHEQKRQQKIQRQRQKRSAEEGRQEPPRLRRSIRAGDAQGVRRQKGFSSCTEKNRGTRTGRL